MCVQLPRSCHVSQLKPDNSCLVATLVKRFYIIFCWQFCGLGLSMNAPVAPLKLPGLGLSNSRK